MSKLSLLSLIFKVASIGITLIVTIGGFMYQELYPKLPNIKPTPQEMCAHLEKIDSEGGSFYFTPTTTLFLNVGRGTPPDNAGNFIHSRFQWVFNLNQTGISFKWGKNDEDEIDINKPDWAAFTWSCGSTTMSKVFDLRDKSSASVAAENSNNVTVTDLTFVPLVEKQGQEENYAYPPP